MLICFGASWPAAIYKTWRVRRTEGKSLLFLSLVLVGYVAGIASKLTDAAFSQDFPVWLTWLYALNAIMVAVDLSLVVRYRRAARAEALPLRVAAGEPKTVSRSDAL